MHGPYELQGPCLKPAAAPALQPKEDKVAAAPATGDVEMKEAEASSSAAAGPHAGALTGERAWLHQEPLHCAIISPRSISATTTSLQPASQPGQRAGTSSAACNI
jgi:hypothetical protein